MERKSWPVWKRVLWELMLIGIGLAVSIVAIKIINMLSRLPG